MTAVERTLSWTRSISPGGSSRSSPCTTSSSCRSRSACRHSSPVCRPPGCGPGDQEYLRATKFWGKLFLINFAMGVVTGIVQEFQFGMNWSAYSRFVGDIFGAPLAIEGLLAFFLESTFLGLWIFGWDRLPKKRPPGDDLAGLDRHHAVRVLHPRRELLDAAPRRLHHQRRTRPRRTHRHRRRADQLDHAGDVPAHHHRVLPHRRRAHARGQRLAPAPRGNQVEVFRPGAAARRLGGARRGRRRAHHRRPAGPGDDRAAADEDGRRRGAVQTDKPASFSIFTIGSLDGREEVASVRIPSLLSFMATGSPDGAGRGDQRPATAVHRAVRRRRLRALRARHLLVVPPHDRVRRPGHGRRRDRAVAHPQGPAPGGRWLWVSAVATVAMPLLANSFGWIFTEVGRQPWTVFGVFKTADRRLTDGGRRHGRHLAHRPHAAVRRARRRRTHADRCATPEPGHPKSSYPTTTN